MNTGLRISIASVICLMSISTVSAQQWTLKQCIEYAVKNNISVGQSDLRTEEQQVRLNTSKNSRLPSLSGGLGGNLYFGRGPSRDGTYTDNTQTSANMNLSASVPIFSGFRIKHDIKGREFDLRASVQDLERAREDVSLNVTSLYLTVLFNKELLKVAESQVELSRNALTKSEALFANGKAPESQIYESKALVAKDELNLTQSKNNLNLSLLNLTQALNLEQRDNFDILEPALDELSVTMMGDTKGQQNIYDYAVENRPAIKAEELRLESSKKSLQIAKTSYYPQISLGAGYSNSYFYSFVDGAQNNSFSHQFRYNGSESIGLNINVPIFNRFATRNQVSTARLSIKSQELTLTQARQTLYKEIEQAYQSADNAYRKYLSANESVKAARIAFKYEQDKSDAGRSTIFDFNDAKTRLERSESDLIQAKFEFVFGRKVLDFYSGGSLDFEKY